MINMDAVILLSLKTERVTHWSWFSCVGIVFDAVCSNTDMSASEWDETTLHLHCKPSAVGALGDI